jgi:hypothetical protein
MIDNKYTKISSKTLGKIQLRQFFSVSQDLLGARELVPASPG